MRNNIGNTEAFLQENQYINHLAEQIMIQNSVNQETGVNPDNMTYEVLECECRNFWNWGTR